MTSFGLNVRLEGDSYFVADLPLCAVRLVKDCNYPWLMLVPRKPDLVEVIDLEEEDQQQLMREIVIASKVLRSVTNCEKLNVGALGNQVSQLHVHIIGRFRNDAAWPGPVWGAVPAELYEPEKADALIEQFWDAFSSEGE